MIDDAGFSSFINKNDLGHCESLFGGGEMWDLEGKDNQVRQRKYLKIHGLLNNR